MDMQHNSTREEENASLKSLLEQMKKDKDIAEARLKRCKQTPMGYKERKHRLLPMLSLSLNGGARKRRVQALRFVIFYWLKGNLKTITLRVNVCFSLKELF